MIFVVAMLEVQSGKRHELLKRMQQLVPHVLAEKGCLDYTPTIDAPTNLKAQAPTGDNVVTLVEKWEDAKALEDHFKTPHMVQYMEDVKNLIVGRKVYILQPA